MSRCFRSFGIAFFLIALASLRGAEAPAIETGAYADTAAVRAVWRPMRGSAPAEHGTIGGRAALRLPVNFAGTSFERVAWDRSVQVDLSACHGVQFEFYCPDLRPVSQFNVYFQSGDGWYAATFEPEAAGAWCTVTIPRSSARIEGNPAGWQRIQTIRLSAWRGRDTDTAIYFRALRPVGVLGVDAEIAVLRPPPDTSAAGRGQDAFLRHVVAGFEAHGLRCATPAEAEVSADLLRRTRLVVLPGNAALPPATVTALADYLINGGRLLAFYHLPAELQAVAGIELGALLKDGEPAGRFAALRPAPGALPGAPETIRQRSWNIRAARPAAASAARPLAEWLDSEGRPSGQVAILGSERCIYMTHVLLADDRANQQRLLLALAARLVPDLWRQAAAAAIARIGEVGGCTDFAAAEALIARQAAGLPRAQTALAEARTLRATALRRAEAGDHRAALEQAPLAERRLIEAFCLAQRPERGEFRAFWCHSAFGVEGMDWYEAIRRLAEAGFNAILPNMLWGGVAYYPSDMLPVAPEVATRGDQIALCLAAAKKYGLQVHVWKVNWNAGHRASPEFVARLRAEGRLQRSSQGKEDPWLCPSHPANQALEIASMVEVARRYEVTGVHFDYIRYPDGDHCFCAGCRERFGQATGQPVARWPQDVLAGGPRRAAWLDWRRHNIDAVVRAVSEQARAVRPGLKISAAVFRNWPTDRDGVGQDWRLWCERGWLDFACPMDYTGSAAQLDNWVGLQREWAGKTPLYPGIGVSTAHLRADRAIAQIEVTRRHRTGGFVIFNYAGTEARELLPLLSLGTTAAK